MVNLDPKHHFVAHLLDLEIYVIELGEPMELRAQRRRL